MLPKIKDIYSAPDIVRADALMTLLNQPPKQEWVKVHPTITGYKYIPIERIEYLLKTIFKRYRIEITGQGNAFNGVWVSVRVHYLNPISGEWDFHDGIGAHQLQLRARTKEEKESGEKVQFIPENINSGALSMSFPIAKTLAVKDACDHLGKLFGSDLNRKDVINYEPDLTLIKMDKSHPNWMKVCDAINGKSFTVEQVKEKYTLTEESEQYLKDLSNGTI